eukprot:1352302-Pleurochrysis_carterae.AAC.1
MQANKRGVGTREPVGSEEQGDPNARDRLGVPSRAGATPSMPERPEAVPRPHAHQNSGKTRAVPASI